MLVVVAVESLSRIWLFATPRTAAHQASLSFTISRSLLKLTCTAEKAMATPSSTLAWKIPQMEEPGRLPSMGSRRVRQDWSDLGAALSWQCHPTISSCRPLLLLPSIFPSIRVFSSELALHIRWPKDWCFSFSISPSNEYSCLTSSRIDRFDLLAVQGTLQSLLQHHSSKASTLWLSAFFMVQFLQPYTTTDTDTLSLSWGPSCHLRLQSTGWSRPEHLLLLLSLIFTMLCWFLPYNKANQP